MALSLRSQSQIFFTRHPFTRIRAREGRRRGEGEGEREKERGREGRWERDREREGGREGLLIQAYGRCQAKWRHGGIRDCSDSYPSHAREQNGPMDLNLYRLRTGSHLHLD